MKFKVFYTTHNQKSNIVDVCILKLPNSQYRKKNYENCKKNLEEMSTDKIESNPAQNRFRTR